MTPENEKKPPLEAEVLSLFPIPFYTGRGIYFEEDLKEAGLTEREAVVEFACRLFDAGRLTLWSAARLAGLDRAGMEDALLARGIPIYRPQIADLNEDLATLDHLGL